MSTGYIRVPPESTGQWNNNMTPEQRDDWHQVSFPCKSLTQRAGHLPQPGGALNANYTQVDAIAIVSAKCGEMGLRYNEDFTWETASGDQVIFRLKDERYKTMLGLSL